MARVWDQMSSGSTLFTGSASSRWLIPSATLSTWTVATTRRIFAVSRPQDTEGGRGRSRVYRKRTPVSRVNPALVFMRGTAEVLQYISWVYLQIKTDRILYSFLILLSECMSVGRQRLSKHKMLSSALRSRSDCFHVNRKMKAIDGIQKYRKPINRKSFILTHVVDARRVLYILVTCFKPSMKKKYLQAPKTYILNFFLSLKDW